MALKPPKKKLAVIMSLVAIILLVGLPILIAWASLHPSRCGFTTMPMSYGVEYREYLIPSSGGYYISLWVLNSNASSDTVFIVMHGYSSCKADPRVLGVASEIANRGYTVVMFDFRGHGRSGGDYTTLGPEETEDAVTVIDWVWSNLGPKRIVLMGYGMGGAVAYVVGASDDRVAAVVADSPYYRLSEAIARWVGYKTILPVVYGKLVELWGEKLFHMNPKFGPANIKSVGKPVIIIYAAKDPLIKYSEVRDLASRSKCKVPGGNILVVKEAGHAESVEELGIKNYVDRILDRVIEPTSYMCMQRLSD